MIDVPVNFSEMDSKQVSDTSRKAGKVLAGKTVHSDDTEYAPPEDVVNADELLAPKLVESLTVEQVKQYYPIKLPKKSLEKATVLINEAINGIGEGLEEFLKSNMIGLLSVMKDNKTNNVKEFINAVKFITFKQAGDTNVRAYAKTFPDKLKRMQEDKIPNSYLHSYAGIYSKSALVTKMQAALIVPTHILYQDVFHKAVMVQYQIMTDDSINPKIRQEAAGAIMTHLKPPEVKQMELQVDFNESNFLEQFKETMSSMAQQQQTLIMEGRYTVSDVAKLEIYDPDKENSND